MNVETEEIKLIKDIIGTREDYHELLQYNSFTDSEKEILLNASVNAYNTNPNKPLIDKAYNILVRKLFIESEQFESPSKTNANSKKKSTREQSKQYIQYKQEKVKEQEKEYELYKQKEEYKQYEQHKEDEKNKEANDAIQGFIFVIVLIFIVWFMYTLWSQDLPKSTTTTTTNTPIRKSKYEYFEGTILENCQKKWGTNYRMVRHCVKNQTEAKEEIGL